MQHKNLVHDTMVPQDSMYRTGNFMVLDVDQDCVRMTKFIETKLNCKFEDGRAFYEVIKNEENLLYYKKILRPQTNKVDAIFLYGVCRHPWL